MSVCDFGVPCDCSQKSTASGQCEEEADSVVEARSLDDWTLLYHKRKASKELSQLMRLDLMLSDTAVSQSEPAKGADSVVKLGV